MYLPKTISFIVISLSVFTAQAFNLSSPQDIQKEIQQASEGAPMHIVKDASFMAFSKGEFRLIRNGSNNFTCLVVREPNGRYEPACFNQPAKNSVFYAYQMHMKFLYMGYDDKQTYQKLQHAFEQGELPLPQTASLVYMMSPNNKIYNPHKKTLQAGMPHHMYFYPKLTEDTFSLASDGPFLWQGFPTMSALIVPAH